MDFFINERVSDQCSRPNTCIMTFLWALFAHDFNFNNKKLHVTFIFIVIHRMYEEKHFISWKFFFVYEFNWKDELYHALCLFENWHVK